MHPVVPLLAHVCVDTQPIGMGGTAAIYRQRARIVSLDFFFFSFCLDVKLNLDTIFIVQCFKFLYIRVSCAFLPNLFCL